jgi:hypothetical protein
MKDVTANRAALRRVMADYFKLRAAEAARNAVINRARMSATGDSEESAKRLQAAMKYMEAFKDEMDRQREQNRDLERGVLDALDGQDDGAFRRLLLILVPPGRHREE